MGPSLRKEEEEKNTRPLRQKKSNQFQEEVPAEIR